MTHDEHETEQLNRIIADSTNCKRSLVCNRICSSFEVFKVLKNKQIHIQHDNVFDANYGTDDIFVNTEELI